MRPSIYRGLNKDALGRAPKRPQATPSVRSMYAAGVTYLFAGKRLVKRVLNGHREHWHLPVVKIDQSIKFD